MMGIGCGPLHPTASSEYGTYKTVTAIIWSWLPGESPEQRFQVCLLARERTRKPGPGAAEELGLEELGPWPEARENRDRYLPGCGCMPVVSTAVWLGPKPDTLDQVRDAEELGHDGHLIRPPTLHRFERMWHL